MNNKSIEEKCMLFENVMEPEGSERNSYPYFSEYFDSECTEAGVYSADLLEERKEYIKGMTIEMIEKVIVVDSYEDDHEQCVDVEIKMKDGNEIVFAAMWIVPEFVADIYAAAKYNVAEAKQEVIGYLQSFLE